MKTTLAIITGFILDALFGDPHAFPHPVRLMGKGIHSLEAVLYKRAKTNRGRFLAGAIMVFVVIVATALVSGMVLYICRQVHPVAGFLAESMMCYQVFAARCLTKESMAVHDVLLTGDMEKARAQVAMIVGRDTDKLDEEGIIRATVETVAENTSDGVIAPLFYMAAGGVVAGLVYKAINTMDSMVGYKNERYLYYGRAAAKLDDAVNYIPARIAAFAMIVAGYLLKGCDGKEAYRIYKRDARKHASPNSAQTESVCAGALGIRLAGDASYFGKIVKKPTIGDDKRRVEAGDIKLANKLMYVTSILVLAAAAGIRCLIFLKL